MDNKPLTKLREKPLTWQVVALGVLLVVAGLWAYGPTLVRVVGVWAGDPDYSHGYLVLPLALLFLWLRRDERPMLDLGFHAGAIGLLLASGLLRCVAGRLFLADVDAWSIPLWIGGVVWMIWGWGALRWALPSIAFLWFAAPLPGTLSIVLSTPLQKFAAQLSGLGLQFFGQPAIVEGTTLLLGDQTLEVEKACSGLRMFYGITALGFAAILITRPSLSRALAIVAAIAPVAILVNVLRIVITGIVTTYFPGKHARQQTHDLAGLFVIPVAMFLFLGILWLIGRLSDNWREEPGRVTKALLGGFVACLALGLALGWWLSIQKNRAMSTLLETADRLEQEGDLQSALEYLNRYAMARPDDEEQQVRLAMTHAKLATSSGEKVRAAELLSACYQKDPRRREYAFQAADLAYQARYFRRALEILDEIKERAPKQSSPHGDPGEVDIELAENRAEVLLACLSTPEGRLQSEYSPGDAIAELETLFAHDAYQPRHAAALAILVRQQSEPSEAERIARADGIIEQLVRDRADDPESWLARYRYGKAYWGNDASYDAGADLDQALNIRTAAPPETQVEMLMAAAERASNRDPSGAAASQFLEQAIGAMPTAVPPYLALAEIRRRAGDEAGRKAAIEILRRGMKGTGGEPLELVFGLARLLAEEGNDAEAEELLEPVRKLLPRVADRSTKGYAELNLAIVEATQAERQGKFAEAAREMQDALGAPETSLAAASRYSSTVEQSWRQLAQLYSILGQSDQALAARQRALAINPEAVENRVALLDAALVAGDLETAVTEAVNGVQQLPDSSAAWGALARVQLQQQLQVPPQRRDFREAEQSVTKAAQLGSPSGAVLVTQVDLLRAQGRSEQASDLLTKDLDADPAQPALWQTLAKLRAESGDAPGALEAIDQFAAHGGAVGAVAVNRAQVLVAMDRADDAFRSLEDALVKATGRARLELMMAMGQLHRQQQSSSHARSLLERAIEEFPGDLAPVEQLARVAGADADWELLERCEKKLRELEGNDGSLWKTFRARRLLATANPLDRVPIIEVAKLAQEITTTRPRWPQGHFLLAHAALRSSDRDGAIRHLESAVRFGMRDATVMEQLVVLLTMAGKTDEAQRYNDQAGDLSSTSQLVYDELMPTLLGSGRSSAALAQAEQWTRDFPKDPQSFVRLGRALLLHASALPAGDQRSREYADAETAFRQAVDIAPGDATAWSSLYAFYLQTQRTEDAGALLEKFEQQVQLEPVDKQIALARLSSVHPGGAVASVKHWRRAIQAAEEHSDVGKRVSTWTQAAAYFSRTDPRLAQQYCRRALSADAKAVAPRLILAQLLSRLNVAEVTAEAIQLLEQTSADQPEITGLRDRLQARLLARRGGPGDAESAIRILESLADRESADLQLLAELYVGADRLSAAYELLAAMATSESASAADIGAFLNFWAKHYKQEENFGGQAREAVARLGRTRNGLPEQLRWMLRLAFTEFLGENDAETNQPNGTAILNRFLSSQNVQSALKSESTREALLVDILRVLGEEERFSEAIEMCRQPPEVAPLFATRLLTNVLIWVSASETAQKQIPFVDAVEKLLDEMILANPTEMPLLQDAADLASVWGRHDRAVLLYERLLAVDPSHEGARNNLATLWNADPAKREAALTMVEQALVASPNSPTLLNTKGEILLQLERPDAALAALEAAAIHDPSSPTIYLHLAQVHEKRGERADAEESLATAMALEIDEQPLGASDKQALAEMRGIFGW